MTAHLLYVLIEFLEKDKLYDMACIVLISLLCHSYRPEKRGKWWNRLALDLKHLKLKKEALVVCNLALDDKNWVKNASRIEMVT